MENRKTTLDREPISSEYIKGKQSLDKVLKGHRAMKPPLWKSAWFYGPVGLATAALIVAVSNMKNDTPSLANDMLLKDKVEDVQLAKTKFFSEPTIVVASKKEIANDDIPQSVEIESEIEIPTEQEIESSEALSLVIDSAVLETAKVDPILPIPPIEKIRRLKTMPNIAGIVTGKLNIDKLCEADAVTCNNGFKVYSYDIQYYNGYGDVIERVRGDQFPPFLCNKLRTYNLNQQVMITNILAKHPDGSVERLISMRIEPTF
jgi:hypothetical protein